MVPMVGILCRFELENVDPNLLKRKLSLYRPAQSEAIALVPSFALAVPLGVVGGFLVDFLDPEFSNSMGFILSPQTVVNASSFSQWLTFRLLGMAYLVGKKFELLFRGSLAE